MPQAAWISPSFFIASCTCAPRRDAGLVRGKVRHRREVELHPVAPGQHREEITVGHRELLAHEVVAAGELAVDVFQLAHDAVLEEGLGLVVQRRREHRAEALVDLRGEEVQPFEQLVALGAAVGRRQRLG
ncbi:hypothetical protein ACVWZV_000698 [Bradyrhizobium sp. GM5.1]